MHSSLKLGLNVSTLAFISFMVVATAPAQEEYPAAGFPILVGGGTGTVDTALGISSDRSQTAVVFGTSGQNAMIVRVTRVGTTLTRVYTESGRMTKAVDALQDSSGNIYVLISSMQLGGYPPGYEQLRILKYSGSMALIQTYPLYGYTGQHTTPKKLVRDANNGNIYVTGTVQTATAGKDIFVVGFQSNGSTCNPIKTYAGPGNFATKDDVPAGIAVDSQGKVLVGGITAQAVGNSTHFTAIKFDPTLNGIVWARRYYRTASDQYCTSFANDFCFEGDAIYMTGTTRQNKDEADPPEYNATYDIHAVRFHTNDTADLTAKNGAINMPPLRTAFSEDDSSFAITRPLGSTFGYGQFKSWPYTVPQFRIDPIFFGSLGILWGMPTPPVTPSTPQPLLQLGSARMSWFDVSATKAYVHLGGIQSLPAGLFIRTGVVVFNPTPTFPPTWVGNYQISSNGSYAGLSTCNNGSVFAAGSTNGPAGNLDFLIMNYPKPATIP